MNQTNFRNGVRSSIILLSLGSILCLGTQNSWGQAAGCGNDYPTGPTGKSNDQQNPDPDSTDPINLYTSDDKRQVEDLHVYGSVGEAPLAFSRYAHSRATPGNAWFGVGHHWRHSYQWEMVPQSANSSGQAVLEIEYPDGSSIDFTQVSSTQWNPPVGAADTLYQSTNDYYLQRQNGWVYHFVYTPATASYAMTDFTDNQGATTTLTYTSGNLTKVTEPGGRSLNLTYTAQNVTLGNFNTLATVPGVPTANQWTQIAVSGKPKHLRYLRYVSPDSGYCDVSEIQFIDTHGSVMTGTPFGSGGGGSTGYANAFDGSTTSYCDQSIASGGYTGIDLGPTSTAVVASIRYYPRPGYESRMFKPANPVLHVSGTFEGSNCTPQSVVGISQVASSDGHTVNYNYTNYSDPTAGYLYPTLSSVSYDDSTQATYTYTQMQPSTFPLAASFVDPRYKSGPLDRSQNSYQANDSNIFGAVATQAGYDTGDTVTTVGATGVHAPLATYGNGAVDAFQMDGTSTGLLVGETDPAGGSISYGHDASGFKSSRSDQNGHSTGFVNSAAGNYMKVTHPDADNSTINWTRDSHDLPLTVQDERSNTTTITRGIAHRATAVGYPDGANEAFGYNSLGQVTSHTLRNGAMETATYDSTGLMQSRTDAQGNGWSYTYDSSGRVASKTDPNTHTTSYQYNNRGLLTQVTYPDTSTYQYGYDNYGNKTSETNEIGKTTSYTYDQYQRLLTVTDPLLRVTHYVYRNTDFNAKPTEIILPSGKTTYFTYDLKWHVLTKIVGYGTADVATTTYSYDAVGNKIQMIDGNGGVWKYTYDMRNRLLTEKNPRLEVTTKAYDDAGNVTSVTRPDGSEIVNTYDTMNRLLTTTRLPNNETTTYTYDAEGNLKTMVDAKGNTYTYTYDNMDRKLSMTYPDSSVESYTYDAVGNMLTFRTREGQVKTSTYDNRNREISYTWSDGTPGVTRSYDAAGRLLSSANSVSTSSYTYDDANEMLSETEANAAASSSWVIAHTYDLDGNKASTTYPSGTVVNYGYTNREQRNSIALGTTTVAGYTYDPNGNVLTKSLGNGTLASYTYNAVNQLTDLNYTLSGTSFAEFAYNYDSVGRRNYEKRDGGKGDVYNYDGDDQVTSVEYDATNPSGATPTGPDRTVNYSYDPVGNRTAVTDTVNGNTSYTANNLNQYTALNSASYTYDGNGNLTFGNGTYLYDAQNRLLTAQVGSTTDQYSYDSKNRVVEREINGVATYYIYDGWGLIEECNSSGTVLASYVHGAKRDELISKTTSSGTVYYHQNGLGSVTHLTNTSGAVVEKYKYDAYGSVSITDGSNHPLSATAYGNRFLFTGREYLAEVGLYDYRNRVYSAALGRFLQTDPERFDAGDVNIYRYCGNNPVNGTDAMGTSAAGWTAVGLGAAGIALQFTPVGWAADAGLVLGLTGLYVDIWANLLDMGPPPKPCGS